MSAAIDPTTNRPSNSLTMPWGARDGLNALPTAASERRIVTILFCDVAGSTAMAELLDPEEWADLMNEAFGLLIRPIERYDGTVIRLMGDAILALFGAPQAHANDPQRAVLAALEIIRDIEALCERIRRQRGLEFNVRIGINTGLVVVGAFGSEALVEYTAMGDAINVAARIQQLAEPGTILVGEETYRLTERLFEYESNGTSDVRGKRLPEQTYRVHAPKSPMAKLRDIASQEMPFTGRAAEMALLQEAVDELRFQGKGRLIVISGEAGVGKSRLVMEFLDHLKKLPDDDGGLPIDVLENQVSPFDRSRPYAGLQARFRKVFGITPDDPPAVVREKFVESGKQLSPDIKERAVRVIQRVMALNTDDEYADDFERDDFKSELTQVVLQIVRRWNPGGAFMLVGEDYQWGDAPSMEILSSVYELLDELPIMFVCTLRPDMDAPVMHVLEDIRKRYSHHMLEIKLDPLPSSDTRELVQSLVAGDSIEAEGLRDVILARSEGNPLFVEEILNALAERGAIERADEYDERWHPVSQVNLTDLSIPTSLQALLLERIDGLPRAARRVLQQAAVLGRSFSRLVLHEISDVDSDLDEHIDELMQAGLIRKDDRDSEETLRFRHAMIQDAAYETILRRHRREFHRRAAESMARLYGDRPTEFAGAIGFHYFQADDSRAIEWLIEAAEQARSVYEPTTITDFAGKAIDLANRLDMEPSVEALQLRGHAHDVLGNYVAARSDLQLALDIARSRGDQNQEWEALIDLGALWAEADYSRAGPLFQDAFSLAQTLNDESKIAYSLNRLGNWHINIGNPTDARNAHQKALQIFERLEDQAGLAETLDLLGLASYLTADFVASATSFCKAIELFRERGDSRGLVSSLAMLALSGGSFDHETSPSPSGQPEEWLGYVQEALDIARTIRWRAGEAFALLVTGSVAAVHGDLGAGQEAARQAKDLASEIGHLQWHTGATICLGINSANLLQFDEAKQLLSEALANARDLGSAYWMRAATSHLVDLHIESGEIEQANALLSSALATDSSLDSVGQRKLWYQKAHLAIAKSDWTEALEVVECLLSTAPGRQNNETIPYLSLIRGQALAGLNEFEAAISELQAGVTQSSELRAFSSLWRLQVTMAHTYAASGNQREANALIEQARATISAVAGKLSDEQSRESFISRAEAELTLR